MAREKRNYKTLNAYADSKIANLYFTFELNRRTTETGGNPAVTAAHPGWTATELQRHAGLFRFFNPFFAQDITMGALPTLYAAVSPYVKSGYYYGPSGFREMRGYPKKVDSNRRSKDEAIARNLWNISEKLTNIEYEI